jgi:hypothetical protein
VRLILWPVAYASSKLWIMHQPWDGLRCRDKLTKFHDDKWGRSEVAVAGRRPYKETQKRISRWSYSIKFIFKGKETNKKKQAPWLESASELYRPSNRRLYAKLVPTFADRGCRVVSATDPYSRILGSLDWSCYYFFQVDLQLYSRGWVDPWNFD